MQKRALDSLPLSHLTWSTKALFSLKFSRKVHKHVLNQGIRWKDPNIIIEISLIFYLWSREDSKSTWIKVLYMVVVTYALILASFIFTFSSKDWVDRYCNLVH